MRGATRYLILLITLVLLSTRIFGFSPPSLGPAKYLSFSQHRISRAKISWKINQQRRSTSLAVSSSTESTSKSESVLVIDIKALEGLDKCKSGTEARAILDTALYPENDEKADSEDNTVNNKPLFGSIALPVGISAKGLSDAELAIQTKIRGRFKVTDLIEVTGDRDADRASAALLCIFIASTWSAVVVDQNLPGPEILRFVVVWALSFAPLAFVGTGIATPQSLQSILQQIQRQAFPQYRKRMIQHEAGHFLMGHLLGLPIQGYATNAVQNAVEFFPLNDPEVGRTRLRQLGFRTPSSYSDDDVVVGDVEESSNAPYFSKEGRGKGEMAGRSVFRNEKNYTKWTSLPSLRNDPTKSWPFRGFDDATIDKLTVVSVAGVCAEILAFGNAEGGYADLSQLREMFRAAQDEDASSVMDNRVRWALGYTITYLRLHLKSLDALADVMERGGSISECVLAIEKTSSNPSGNDGIRNDYEVERRASFLQDSSPLEMFMLRSAKNAESEDDSVVEGKGGGGKLPKKFAITGDDPLYIAIGIACVFFVWASNGGLSLH